MQQSNQRFTDEQIDFLKSISYMGRKKMAALFNEKFNQNRTYDSMKRFCMRYGLKRDFELDKKPKNKTTFKKGMVPHNVMSIGDEYIHPTNGMVLIKTEQGRVFKHHHVWGKPIPNTHMLTFKDGNKLNCDIDNLILVERGALLRYNQSYRRYATHENNETLLLLGMLRHAKFKRIGA